jgi:hypothetical protein
VALEHVAGGAVAVPLAIVVITVTQVDDLVARGAFVLPVGAAGTAAEGGPGVSFAAAAFTVREVLGGAFVVEVAGVEVKHANPLSTACADASPARSRLLLW